MRYSQNQVAIRYALTLLTDLQSSAHRIPIQQSFLKNIVIDTFVKVIDKCIDLAKTRQQNNQQYFELIINPFFQKLELVVRDYFHLFRSEGITQPEAASIRDGYIKSRIKTTTLAEAYIKHAKDSDIQNFFLLALNFFYGNFYAPSNTIRSNGYYYVEIISGKRTFVSFNHMPKSLKAANQQLEDRWAMIVHVYAKLAIKYRLPSSHKI